MSGRSLPATGFNMGSRWEETPFVALAITLAIGIASASLLRNYSFAGLALGDASLAAASLLALRNGRLRTSLGLGLGALALGGLLLGLAERDGYARDDVRALQAKGWLAAGELLLLDACVLEASERRGLDLVTTVELHGLRRKDEWVRCRGRVQLRMAAAEEEGMPGGNLRYGDRIRAWASCAVPRNLQNPGSPDRTGALARRGIHLLARVKSPRLIEVLPRDCGTPWNHATARIRSALRDRIGRFARNGDRQQAAILSSIVLGDDRELAAETRTIFQNAGTYHVLVVSGLHVGWIALILIRSLGLLRVPAGVTRLATAGGIFMYAGIVGFQASISRALWMFALYLAAQSLFRRASPANIVFACAFALLCLQPSFLQDAGFQLSFLSVLAIVVTALPVIENVLMPLLAPLRNAGDPGRLFLQEGRWQALGRSLRFRAEIFCEALSDRCHRKVGSMALGALRGAAASGVMIASLITISLAVQLWLGPMLAFYFNRLSWLSPVANLAAVPISSLALAAGMAAVIASSLVPPALPLFRLAGWFCWLLLRTSQWVSSVPGSWQRCPTPPGLWVGTGLLLIFLWFFLKWRRSWIPCVLVGLELSCLSLAELNLLPAGIRTSIPAIFQNEGAGSPHQLRLSFLDVGQGDAIVIEFPDARTWVIDAGGLRVDAAQAEAASPFDIGEAVVSRFLWSRWIVGLDRVILSHSHQDHSGGIPALLQNFPAGRLDYGRDGDEAGMPRILEAARTNRVPVHAAVAGEEYMVAGAVITVLNPATGRAYDSVNDASLALRLQYGNFTALLAGDMEGGGETSVLARLPASGTLLLKVAHHGSRNATLDPFLGRILPRWAVISVGATNPFGNPAPETLRRLENYGARLLLTSELGAIFLETDGARYTLRSHVRGVLEQGLLLPPRDH